MSGQIFFSQAQARKFAEIVKQFKDIEYFLVRTDESSGIGVGLEVSFNLFNDNTDHPDATINITDFSE